MAKRKIRISTDEVLRKKCKEVKEITPNVLTLLEDMAETMYDANGVGLAAPQVGVLKRIVVIDVGDGLVEMINPEILETKEIAFKCHCSKDGMKQALMTVGKEELQKMIQEDHGCEITCHWCNEHYNFSEEELKAIEEFL